MHDAVAAAPDQSQRFAALDKQAADGSAAESDAVNACPQLPVTS